MIVEILTLLLLFVIGYAALRTSVCMVAAAQEIVERRTANRLTGFLLAAACSALAMAASLVVGRDPFSMITGYPASVAAVAGGALFALGAAVNGRCAMGTLTALASGEIRHIATLGGMVGAAMVATPIVRQAIGYMGAPPATPSLLSGTPPTIIATGAAITLLLLGFALHAAMKRARAPQLWSPLFTMILIGIASGMLFALDRRWPYTSLINSFATGDTTHALTGSAHALVLFAAMIVGAATAGLIRFDPGTARKWVGAAGGGLLMGVGASLVPGGNDAMLMTGVPLLLPNLILAYASMIAVLLAIIWARSPREATITPPDEPPTA